MEWLHSLFANDMVSMQSGFETALLTMLVAFIIGHIVAWTYMATHSGLSYSQSFCASLLVQPVIVSLIMLLMAGSILVAIGLFAVFAMVRFRNVLKDTRDTTFILWAIVEGVAAGTTRYSVALAGAAVVALVFFYLYFTSFAGRHRYDVILSLEWTGNGGYGDLLRPILRRHALHAQLAGQHDLDVNKLDLSYRVLLRDPARSRELVADLENVQGVTRVSLFHRTDEAEV